MACGMIAMKNAGVDVERYVAYENDKYAIQTAKENFPNIEECGDVFDGDYNKYRDFDFLVGGSPCTHWSVARTHLERETTASGVGWELFSQYVRALNESKPKYFIYENNKSMSDEIRDSISEKFGFEPVCINSALVSAQSRKRLYWIGKRNDSGGYDKVNVNQPNDKHIVLRDVLDKSDVTMPYSGRGQKDLTDAEIGYMTRAYQDRRWNFTNKPDQSDKSPCLTANVRKGVPYNVVCENVSPIQVGALPRPNGELSSSQGFRIYSINGKSVTLKGNAGGAGGKTGLYAIPQNEPIHTTYTVKDHKLYVNGNGYKINLDDGEYIIRKLSVEECMRLQTVPNWYVFPVSNSQAYKMLGNGWTCDVITHIIKCCVG